MEYICEWCGEHFDSETPKRFCSSKCAHRYSFNTRLKWKCDCGEELDSKRKFIAHIKRCAIAHEKHQYLGRGRGWARGRKLSEENRKHISEGLIRYAKKNIGKLGKSHTEDGEILRKQRISASMKGNTNWEFNKKHGAAKQGWYNGVYCDSSWELAFVVYHLEHNLSITRCRERRKYTYNGIERIYVPDFVTDEGIIEIKGYLTEQSKAKMAQNPDIKVLMEEDMQKYLDYVIGKYGNRYWEVLYEK